LCREVGILDHLMPELIEAQTTIFESATGQLVPSPEERDQYLRGMLRALDAVRQREANIPQSVAFATLLLSAYTALERSDQNERNWIDKLCVAWSERIRLPRHDQDRIRLLLSAVQLSAPVKLEQKSGQYVVKKAWFKDALLLFIMDCWAKEQPLDIVARWKSLAEKAKRPYVQDKHGNRPMRPHFSKRRHFSRGRRQRQRV